jgi:hypothetical protein
MLPAVVENGGNGFLAGLADLGFQLAQEDRKGVRQYARMPNRLLTEWVHDYGDEVLFTWEFDLGAFCAVMGWQIGAAEPGAHMLFPQHDARLARDAEAVATEVQRLESRLQGLDLSDPAL